MSSPIEQAMRQICEEKGLSYESVLHTIEAALSAAYRKDFGEKNQNVEAEFNPATGDIRVFDVKTVVEDVDLEELERRQEARRQHAEEMALVHVAARERGEDVPTMVLEDGEDELRFNPKTDLMISEARQTKPDAELGEIIRTELPQPGEFGRMAAMPAKQVITQTLREAEREIVFNEFKEKEGEVLNGTIQRREGRIVLVDLGRIAGILRPEDQVSTERYAPGEKIKVYVRQVSLTGKGPEIVLSRTAEELVKRIFEVEIPEVGEGTVEVKAIAREPGSRSKVAVFTNDSNLDPIGACIGQRGTRIQTIIGALGGEKIDIIEWSEDPKTFIAHALAPAKVNEVELRLEERLALVKVPADQLSLAIGKGGQNVRLAVRLTGWKINANESGSLEESAPAAEGENGASEPPLASMEAVSEETPAA
ncbi:transcription termination/antitermination protein NusA [Candidatus Uhrbacteria bacterium]|nr:transcription termination/antitermination protein NusA [Candidatus Uhrbacteria bacterium]